VEAPSAPTVPIETKICMEGNDVTCAEFQGEIFRGYDFTGGGSNFPFSYWFLMPYNCDRPTILHLPKFSDLY